MGELSRLFGGEGRLAPAARLHCLTSRPRRGHDEHAPSVAGGNARGDSGTRSRKGRRSLIAPDLGCLSIQRQFRFPSDTASAVLPEAKTLDPRPHQQRATNFDRPLPRTLHEAGDVRLSAPSHQRKELHPQFTKDLTAILPPRTRICNMQVMGPPAPAARAARGTPAVRVHASQRPRDAARGANAIIGSEILPRGKRDL